MSAPFVAVPCAAVGALHGATAGARGIYAWRSWRGPVAFAVDHSWGLVMSAASLFSQGVGTIRRDGTYAAELSERRGRHVYVGGFRVRPGFAITLGTTVSGISDLSARRRKLVDEHEDVHVWQARWFGPSYPVLYLGWMAVAAAAGVLVALVTRRRPIFARVEAYAYYANPFEWWAYSCEGRWPPSSMAVSTWRRPAVQALAERRAARVDDAPISPP